MLAVPTAAEVTASNITSTNIHPIGPESIWQPALERGLLQGKRCKKRHAVRVVAEVTYRCRGKAGNLRWRKIVPRPPAGPTPAPGPATPVDGDPCTTIGERIEMASGYLECRKVGGDKRVYRHLTVDPPSPGITVSPEPIETCRLLDTRVNRGRPPGPGGTLISEAIAYPVTSATRPLPLPAAGTTKVAVLPIDFIDVPGDGNPQGWLGLQLRRVDAWIEHFSDGRLGYEWVTSGEWNRASKPSTRYQFIHPSRGGVMPPGLPQGPFQSEQWITEDLLRSVPTDLDLTGVKAIVFVYPPQVEAIYDLAVRDLRITSPRNLGHVLMFTTGRWLYEEDRPLWSYMIHEFGHFHGIPGHAPFDGNPLDVMTNQHGMAITLNTWSRLTMDWIDTDAVYCTRREGLGEHEVTLSPIDRDETGTKAVMVRLSDSQALIIESRRRSEFSSDHFGWPGLPAGFYGLTVMRVDTSVDLNRVQRPGAYLDYIEAPELNHGILRMPLMVDVDLDWVLYEGESMTVDGVRIELLRSGDFDTVRVGAVQ